MSRIGNQPAFPCDELPGLKGPLAHPSQGMTYRQWLAGMALQGLLANSTVQMSAAHVSQSSGRKVVDINSSCACEHADAVLSELEKNS